ncbi:putative ribonuclease H-like domain-containing protein [Tanacetum coccineum]
MFSERSDRIRLCSIKRVKGDILLVQVYVDDIIFGSTKKGMCIDFEKMMHKKFQISSMGELTFFLGLQVAQKDDGIFISQDKYVDEIFNKFGFSTVKTESTPMETSQHLMKDANAEDVDVHLYRSMIGSLMYLAFFEGLIYFVKSTAGGCQFLGSRLISWQCKKQTVVANSTTEAEYVVASSCYGQWIIRKRWLEWNATATKGGIEVKTSNSKVNAIGHKLVLLEECFKRNESRKVGGKGFQSFLATIKLVACRLT